METKEGDCYSCATEESAYINVIKNSLRSAKEFKKYLNSLDPEEYPKIREELEQERLKKRALIEAECSSFVKDCSRFGYNIKTTWTLMGEKNLDPELVSIMIKYLYDTNYSNYFREGILRCLMVPEAAPYFKDFLDLFTKEEGSPIRYVIGYVLANAAKTQDELNIIESLIFDKKVGKDRWPLSGAIKRMKGEQRERTLTFAREDPEIKDNLHFFRLGGGRSKMRNGE